MLQALGDAIDHHPPYLIDNIDVFVGCAPDSNDIGSNPWFDSAEGVVEIEHSSAALGGDAHEFLWISNSLFKSLKFRFRRAVPARETGFFGPDERAPARE